MALQQSEGAKPRHVASAHVEGERLVRQLVDLIQVELPVERCGRRVGQDSSAREGGRRYVVTSGGETASDLRTGDVSPATTSCACSAVLTPGSGMQPFAIAKRSATCVSVRESRASATRVITCGNAIAPVTRVWARRNERPAGSPSSSYSQYQAVVDSRVST